MPGPPQATDREVRQIVAGLREGCKGCGYRRICVFAPVKYQIDFKQDPRARHRHDRVLMQGLLALTNLGGDWQGALIRMAIGREKDALLAGCLLFQAWRKDPQPLHKLLDYTLERCEVDRLKEEAEEVPSEPFVADPQAGVDPVALQELMFRGQVLRIAAFFPQEEVLTHMQELFVLKGDEEQRLFQYEAVAVLALLVGRSLSGTQWIKGLEREAHGPFRATFAHRDPGSGAIDIFFPYRRGKKRSYLYLRRDGADLERLSSVDKVRIDSLLYRIFLVFHTDEMKTHRVFKELCRHINVRAGEYNVNHLLAGFQRLQRDDLLLLGIYAPALARAVGHFLQLDEFHLLVKFLYQLRSESGRRGEPKVAAHEKVVESRNEWDALVDQVGADVIKDVFSVLFRLNAGYKPRVYTSPTYLKIGEVAYLLTAMQGWNPKGMEIELKKAHKPLAFVGYGLQPPGKWSKIRTGKLERARNRAEERGKDQIVRAAEQGMRYMALLHGFESFEALKNAVARDDWRPPERFPSQIELPVHASAEDFSEFELDSHDTLEGLDPNSGDDMFVVVEDDQTDEHGNLKTQRRHVLSDDEIDLDEISDTGNFRPRY